MNDNSKPVVTEEEIPMPIGNFTFRQVGYVKKSASDVQEEFANLKDLEHMGTMICHAFCNKDGGGVAFVAIPFLAQVPENAASLMMKEIQKSMMGSYGRGSTGFKQ